MIRIEDGQILFDNADEERRILVALREVDPKATPWIGGPCHGNPGTISGRMSLEVLAVAVARVEWTRRVIEAADQYAIEHAARVEAYGVLRSTAEERRLSAKVLEIARKATP